MAEAFNLLFEAECIPNPIMRPKGGWGGVGEVEIAVAEYIEWFNCETGNRARRVG